MARATDSHRVPDGIDSAKNAALTCLLQAERAYWDLAVAWNTSGCHELKIVTRSEARSGPPNGERIVYEVDFADGAGNLIDDKQWKSAFDAFEAAASATAQKIVTSYTQAWETMPPELLEAIGRAMPGSVPVRSFLHDFPTAHEACKHLALELLEIIGPPPPRMLGTFRGDVTWDVSKTPVSDYFDALKAASNGARWDLWKHSVIARLQELPELDVQAIRTRVEVEWAKARALPVRGKVGRPIDPDTIQVEEVMIRFRCLERGNGSDQRVVNEVNRLRNGQNPVTLAQIRDIRHRQKKKRRSPSRKQNH